MMKMDMTEKEEEEDDGRTQAYSSTRQDSSITLPSMQGPATISPSHSEPAAPAGYHVDSMDAPENEESAITAAEYHGLEGKEGIDKRHFNAFDSHPYSCPSSCSSSSPSTSTVPSSPVLPDHPSSFYYHSMNPSQPDRDHHHQHTRRPSIHDDLFQHLRATLTSSSSSSIASPDPSILSSGSSTPRASDYYFARSSQNIDSSRPNTASSSASDTHTTAATTPATASSSGSSSPDRTKRHYLSSTSSSNPLSSVIKKGSQVISTTTNTIDLNQAISLSIYAVVTMIALISLLSILVAGYGLTLADDMKRKIGTLGRNVEKRRKKIMNEFEEWMRLASEHQMYSHRAALQQDRYSHVPSNRKRRASYPQASRKERPKEHASNNLSETLRSSVRAYATIAYSKLPFSTTISERGASPARHRHRKKSKSQPSSRPRSRCSSPPPVSLRPGSSTSSWSAPFSSSTSSAKGNAEHSSSPTASNGWSKLPPRPPLSVLIPGMLLAVLLALVAFFKNSSNTKKSSSNSSVGTPEHKNRKDNSTIATPHRSRSSVS
ncbi:hypothetical protein P389DRAFT_207912 [Cystobasidium minutum MCA 4210]|uniref:uncharacterized protein n=1 Tax=Cystobasidium minutum MCA 4210 TaxID=1397322 RepID=UPI0034CDB458|eukprot:jgi/Rhomi1/207912/estExt_Genemark1.C_1_t20396